MHYLLIYHVCSDYVQRRTQFREEHLRLAWQAHERGDLLLGGALAEPVDQAVLLFQSDGPEAARAFAEADPYVREGLVEKWEVRPWTTVVGAGASVPIQPKAE